MSRPPVRSLLVTAFFSCALLAPDACAAPLQLEEKQSRNFYVSHVGGMAFLSAASLAIATDPQIVLGARWKGPPHFEKGVQQNSSPLSSTVSDVTLLTSLLAPLASLYASKEGASYQNSLIVYGQALTASLLLNSMSKNLVLRARPSVSHEAVTPITDDHLSFYSGHSSLSFAAATSGSYLHAAVESDLTLRSLHFGTAFALASFTAHARVRAGRHYPTDVLLGALSGIGVGIAVPLLHGVDARISEEEIASAGAGLFLGTVAGSALPKRVRQQLALVRPELEVSEFGLSFGASGSF
jgi:membrane-associated phospholipid phosphatase